MVAALTGLAIALAAVVQLLQQRPDQLLTDLEAFVAHRFGQMPLAATDPTQRRLGISADRSFDQPLKRCQKPRLTFLFRFAPSTRTPNRTADLVLPAPQLRYATIDRAPRHARRHTDRLHPAVTHRHRFIGCKQTTTALIQKWFHPLKTNAYVVLFHHRSNQLLLQTPIVLQYRVNFASNPNFQMLLCSNETLMPA